MKIQHRNALFAVALLALISAAGWWFYQTQAIVPMQAEILSLSGDVQINGADITEAGSTVDAEGARIQLGENGVASIRLEDGSIIQLSGGADLEIRAATRSRDLKTFKTKFHLEAGEIIRNIPEVAGRTVESSLSTPSVEVGVRGTEFSVSVGDDGASTINTLRGKVALQADQGEAIELPANYGTKVEKGKAPERPSVLPPPPLLVDPEPGTLITGGGTMLAWVAVPEMTGYVVEIAEDAGFQALVQRVPVKDTTLALPELADDRPYYWRVASRDARGLKGRGAEARKLHYRVYAQQIKTAVENHQGSDGLAVAEKALAGYPDDPQLLKDVGWLHYLERQYDDARKYYDQVLGTDGTDIEARIERARVAYWQKDYALASSDYKAVLDVQPDEPDALWGLADTRIAQGETAEARTLLSRVLVLQPSHAYAGYSLALLEMKEGNSQWALKLMRRHVAGNPKHAEAVKLLKSWSQ